MRRSGNIIHKLNLNFDERFVPKIRQTKCLQGEVWVISDIGKKTMMKNFL